MDQAALYREEISADHAIGRRWLRAPAPNTSKENKKRPAPRGGFLVPVNALREGVLKMKKFFSVIKPSPATTKP
jgi:hypothetical protein